MEKKKIYEIVAVNTKTNFAYTYHYNGTKYTEEEAKDEFKLMMLTDSMNKYEVPVNISFEKANESYCILRGCITFKDCSITYELRAYSQYDFFERFKLGFKILIDDKYDLTPEKEGIKSPEQLKNYMDSLIIDNEM